MVYHYANHVAFASCMSGGQSDRAAVNFLRINLRGIFRTGYIRLHITQCNFSSGVVSYEGARGTHNWLAPPEPGSECNNGSAPLIG